MGSIYTFTILNTVWQICFILKSFYKTGRVKFKQNEVQICYIQSYSQWMNNRYLGIHKIWDVHSELVKRY